MGAPPRTRLFYRPLLEDIHRTAVAWQNRHELMPHFLTPRFRVILLRFIALAALAGGAAIAAYAYVHTNVRKQVTTAATWEIRDEGSTRVVYLAYPGFPDFAEEAIVSDQLEQHLEASRPTSVRVTMVVVYDFDVPKTKGPAFTVDGIEVDQ